MKLDDRFMTILTALVLLVGIGALLSRGEDGESVFGGPDSYSAKPDSFAIRAGRVQSLAILSNDDGADLISPGDVRILSRPACGEIVAVEGVVTYSESDLCEGKYTFDYCVPWEDDCETTEVTLQIINVEEQHRRALEVAARDGASTTAPIGPEIQTDVESGPAVEEINIARPVRLQLPSAPDRMEPDMAADLRTLGGMSPTPVESTDLAELTSTDVRVEQSSARPGGVSFGTSDLTSPGPEAAGTSDIIISAVRAEPDLVPTRPVASGSAAPAIPRPQVPAAPPAPQATAPSVAPPTPRTTEPDPVPQMPVISASREDGRPAAPVVPVQPAPVETAAALPSVGSGSQPPVRTSPLDRPAAPTVEASPVVPQTDSAPVRPATGAPRALTALSAVDAPSALPDTASVSASSASGNSRPRIATISAERLIRPTGADQPARLNAAATRSAPQPRNLGVAVALPGQSDVMASLGPALLPLPTVTDVAPNTDTSSPTRLSVHTPLQSVKISTRPAAPPTSAELGLTPAPTALASRTVPGGSDTDAIVGILPACGIRLSLTSRSGAEIIGTLESPCRPETTFVVSHAGLVFTERTDDGGGATFSVPALQASGEIRVEFGDGGIAEETVPVNGLEGLTRIAILWTADIDFDLHALEFGAREGGQGHIWSGQPGSYGDARRSGAGYLVELGPESGPGAKAEVYTLVENSRTPGGLIDLSLRLAAFGNDCEAQPVIRTLRVERGVAERDSDIQFALSGCGSPEEVFIPNMIQDVRVDRR
ncbi:MAG: hypothetical protein AAGA32_04940 [Pseudomonadota bacterium]